jgi:hypothetical protein
VVIDAVGAQALPTIAELRAAVAEESYSKLGALNM